MGGRVLLVESVCLKSLCFVLNRNVCDSCVFVLVMGNGFCVCVYVCVRGGEKERERENVCLLC